MKAAAAFRALALLALTTPLAGCGLAETGAAAGAAGAASAEQVEQVEQQLERTREAIDAAQKSAADARAKAEEMSQ